MDGTQEEYSGVPLNLGALYIYVIMVDVTQTRWKKCNACGAFECGSLRECTDISP